MSDMLSAFVEQIAEVYGTQLVSVVLYGSQAGGGEADKHSDYNVLIVLTGAGFSEIRAIDGIVARWIKAGNPAPLIFSRAMLANSLDVFPIEFWDIKNNHKVLWGEDVVGNVSISDANLRHQCEYELKGKLLHLRQMFLGSRQKPRAVREIMIGTISSIVTVSRHVLRLAGDNAPGDRTAAIERLSLRAGFDHAALGTVLALKHGNKEALRRDPIELFEHYINAVEKIADYVDGL